MSALRSPISTETDPQRDADEVRNGQAASGAITDKEIAPCCRLRT